MDKREDAGSDEEIEIDMSNPDALTKQRRSAEIANRVMAQVVLLCIPGAVIADVCVRGDNLIIAEVNAMYKDPSDAKKTKMEKGVAFPTCLSVNSCVCHYSPSLSNVEVLRESDVIKIDLGVQIDGFISVCAHTIVLAPNSPEAPLTGRLANVICAAHLAGEVALRTIRPGVKNTAVTDAIARVAQAFQCNPADGVLSHQLKRFVIDGNKVIQTKVNPEARVEEFEFGVNEVYGIDIVMSSGEGKFREEDDRKTQIYKRVVDQNYNLKTQAARQVLSEIIKDFPALPFNSRFLEAKFGTKSRLGLNECLKHDLLSPYPVLYERPGHDVAHFKFTCIVLPQGTVRLTSHALPHVSSEFRLPDNLQELLAVPAPVIAAGRKQRRRGGKTSAAAGAAATEDATGDQTPPPPSV